jgi:hypothetical protein
MTNLRDEDDEELLTAVKRMGKQHQVIVASMREDVLDPAKPPCKPCPRHYLLHRAMDYLNAGPNSTRNGRSWDISNKCLAPGIGCGLVNALSELEKNGTL